MAGGMAGFCQVVATNPMEMVKIQMQLAATKAGPIPSTWTCVKALGLTGLYRGSLATLMRDVPFSMILFETFATLKQQLQAEDRFEMVFVAGLLAGATAAFLATPMDVVKTRLQAAASGARLASLYGQIWRQDPRSFFKGAPQRCLIVAPLFGISLLAYEIQQRLFLTLKTIND